MPSLNTGHNFKQAINHYYNELDKIHRFGGSRNETSIRTPFVYLVNHYAEKRNLLLITEIGVAGKKGNAVYPDGVLKNALRFEFGYWEAKDTKDNFDYEIKKKLYEDGYPDQNILFEDTETAVLYQEGSEVLRVQMKEADGLDAVLNQFISYEPIQVKNFNKALIQFTQDVPSIVENLRQLLQKEAETNKEFIGKRNLFHQLAQEEINPQITSEDIREMLIQHILTEDIFNNVFGNSAFHRFNNIARELEGVLDTFMTYDVRQNHLQSIKSYYQIIRDASARLGDHHEKQKFLKVIYENFYKVYNPKGADRLGVVYTPNEVVRFMIESTDWLLEKHFGKNLGSQGVEILDPATGTGTFIAELIEHINPHDLPHKYENEMHANEVAILPYYIANLNIEYTYQQKMNDYKMFQNICFVDTLDNLEGLKHEGQHSFSFGLSSENAKRIQNQNKKKISVIIGNPPYNANQANFNDFNKNRLYDHIDSRIKETFVYRSSAQKTKVYDMYARFYRWAIDRIEENGIIAFITNRSFIDSRTFDGFRSCIQDEFDFAYIVDTHSDVRANPKIAGTSHNVFGIQTGVAVMLLVRREKQEKTQKRQCRIYYTELDDFQRKEQKLDWLRDNPLSKIAFQTITPDEKYNWIFEENDFDSLLPLISKEAKAGKSEYAVFKLYSLGVSTNRDEWITDLSPEVLQQKMSYFISEYDKAKTPEESATIKWSRNLNRRFLQQKKEKFDEHRIKDLIYRPYSKKLIYFSDLFIDEKGNAKELFVNENKTILCCYGERLDFCALATNHIPSLNFFSLEVAQNISLYRYDETGKRHDNISDWALSQFQKKYDNNSSITKNDIFYYIYGVLHCPQYRKKYKQNLKREFPRIPFYEKFFQWRDWGNQLMSLHIDYDNVAPYPLERVDVDLSPTRKNVQEGLFDALSETVAEVFIVKPQTKLRANQSNGTIDIDSQTTLNGVPPQAWEYKLGNRSALEWILDQYKERKPKDATIAERFNFYKFENYKETVIDLLMRVCSVSVKTVKIINQMPD